MGAKKRVQVNALKAAIPAAFRCTVSVSCGTRQQRKKGRLGLFRALYRSYGRKVLIEKVQHSHNSTMIALVCPVGLSNTALLKIMFLEIHHV
jgi:hypothetical protein